MSDSSPPPQLRLSLDLPPHGTFKRSFDSFFTAPTSAAARDATPIPGATSGQSSSSAPSPEGDENRRKRARSAESLSDPEDRSSEASTSTLSSSSPDQQAHRHLLLDLGLGRGLGSSVALSLSMASTEFERGISEPPRIPTPELLETDDVDMPDLMDAGFLPREHHEEPAQSSHAEHVRRSVDRFNAFDRHISVLRSSSPPVIPLPASLNSHQTSLSPPTLPPLPLVDLGLDAEDEDEENIPSTVATTTTNTPPRLDLNLPSTSSLSSAPNSPTGIMDDASAAQFRERLDSAIDGLGGGDLQMPQAYSASPAPLASSSRSPGNSLGPLPETPLFEWPPGWLDHGLAASTSTHTRSSETSSPLRRPSDIGSPPPLTRLYPRPASLAAPSVSATTSALDPARLDVDLGAFLDIQHLNTNRAWESAVDRARSLRREREREARERDDRERERQRVREEEAEREEEHPWSMDSIWERASRRPWEAPLLSGSGRTPLPQERGEVELMRRRAMQRQREEHGLFVGSRSARYLESGLVDPREASRPLAESSSRFSDGSLAALRERQLRPVLDTSNVMWVPRRPNPLANDFDAATRIARARSISRREDEPALDTDVMSVPRRPSRPVNDFDTATRIARARSISRSREDNPPDWLTHLVSPTDDDWIPGIAPLPANPEGETSRRPAGENSSRPRLPVSPQSTAQPTRTATHARAQSSSITSMPGQPSIHRLRSRLHGQPRVASLSTANSLVAENAAAIRRAEVLERLHALNASMDVDASEPEDEWEPFLTRRTRSRRFIDDIESDEEDMMAPPYLRRARDLMGLPPSRRLSRYRRPSDASPVRQNLSVSRPRSTWRATSPEAEEPPVATSSGLNNRRPLSLRRSIPRLRQHPTIGGEISPPPPASASVDRRHASWEAPTRDAEVSSTYQYLSALSHGFDSRSLSISDLAHTITNNSNSEALRRPPSPPRDSPFSSLFGASSLRRNRPNFRRFDDAMETEDVPSLPPPDLGGNFERPEDLLRDAPQASTTVDSPTAESPPTRNNPATLSDPFGLTIRRMSEYRRILADRAPIPDPPSIPPLQFGSGFQSTPSPLSPPDETRPRWSVYYHRPESPSREFSSNAAERRPFHHRGGSDADPRRFFPSRPTATSHVHREPEPRPHRYSATDVHNALARQARLPGSRLAPDRPSSPDDMDALDLRHEGLSSFRAERLISQFHEQAAAAAPREPSSSSSWATLSPSRSRPDADVRRRRYVTNRNSMLDTETLHFRHRTAREPPMHPMFRFRRRALGDYMRDEDFDNSYETLLSLGAIMGDVKPKATPEHVVAGLESAAYKDWATAESDQRCPICLDDYQASDPVTKLGDCRHWLHKECLEQWLKGASTCPVCRKDVKGKGKRPHNHGPGSRRDGPGPGPSGSGAGAGPGPSGGGGGPAFLHFWGRNE